MYMLPYDRLAIWSGGSPLQNLIIRGIKETKLTALQMIGEVDAGPVYEKRSLSLEGSAEEIYIRASRLAADLIQKIVEDKPVPLPQVGTGEKFERRKPKDSMIPSVESIEELYDFIRMLDAPTYPKAFLIYRGKRYEISGARFFENEVIATVKVRDCD